VLLREMEGFQGAPRCIIIGATNRRQDLDPALISRFDATVTFPLPDAASR
jgi:ATP-dependent 26S proteasome regulatory subunit